MTRKTLRNGDVVDTRIAKHRDGTRSLKRTVVARGIRPAKPSITLPADPMQPKTAIPDGSTKSAARNARKVAKAPPAPKLATPETIKERTHHEHSVDQAAYVQTTNVKMKMLRRIKARTGSHIEAFERDYEMAGSDLRSSAMEGGGGGGGMATPFPLAKVQAIDRLKRFEQENMVAFKMCEAALIFGHSPASIHKAGGPPHVVCSHMIREAVDDLAAFYTPQRKRPDKNLAVVVKLVDEARRRFEANLSERS